MQKEDITTQQQLEQAKKDAAKYLEDERLRLQRGFENQKEVAQGMYNGVQSRLKVALS